MLYWCLRIRIILYLEFSVAVFTFDVSSSDECVRNSKHNNHGIVRVNQTLFLAQWPRGNIVLEMLEKRAVTRRSDTHGDEGWCGCVSSS